MFNGFSWKTTTGGIISILSGIGMIVAGLFGKIDTTVALTSGFTSITTGVALLNAKDNNVHTDILTGQNITVKK